MNDISKLYENYWQSKKGLEKFTDYERNSKLKDIFKPNEKILDLASGEGAVAEFIKSLGCEVVAVDMSREALKKAARRGVKTVLANVEEKLPFKNEEFDGVFWGDNAEHLFRPDKTLIEINRILKKGGKLVISCPNMGYFRYRIYYLFNGIIPDTEFFNLPLWQWEHIRFFNKKVMEEFLRSGNFNLNKFIGVSRRKIDKLFMKLRPEVFGMIMVVEAIKR